MPEADHPVGLKCELRPYQRQALAWMADREAGAGSQPVGAGAATGSGAESKGSSAHGTVRRHPLWDEYAFADGSKFYLNPYNGEASLRFPRARPSARGGILADEMGRFPLPPLYRAQCLTRQLQ